MSHIQTYLADHLQKIHQLHSIVLDYQSFLLVGHSNPDGDCYGSLLGMGRWLRNQGKHVSFCVAEKKTGPFAFVEGADEVDSRDNGKKEIPDAQVVIFLDLCMAKRLAGLEVPLFAKTDTVFCCIDHHVQTESFTSCDIVDTASSSCCELIRELLCYFDPEHTYIDDKVAGYCFLGTMTDTGGEAGFVHEKDSIRTFENALSMLQSGAAKWKAYYIKHMSKITMGLVQFTQLLRSRIITKNNLVWTRYKDTEYYQYGLDPEQAKWGFDVLKRTQLKNMFVRAVQYDSEWYLSMRSSNNVNARLIAEYYGGGGHDKAAACSIGANINIDQIIDHIDVMVSQQQ